MNIYNNLIDYHIVVIIQSFLTKNFGSALRNKNTIDISLQYSIDTQLKNL